MGVLPVHGVGGHSSSASPSHSSCGTFTSLGVFPRFFVVGASSGFVPSKLQMEEQELHSNHRQAQVLGSVTWMEITNYHNTVILHH